MKLSEYKLVKNALGLIPCPICAREFKPLGLSSHFHRAHNPEYRNIGSYRCYKSSWNKGLTALTDVRVANSASALSVKTKGRQGRKISDEQREKVSNSMKIAHAEGRAHNIGSSRWNNEPSYPEKFFIKVIENEFFDKNYKQEFSFGRFSLDFAWVEKKLCIEIDGEQHERFESYRLRDERKDKALTDAGWKILRIKWKDMFSDTKNWIEISKNFIDN